MNSETFFSVVIPVYKVESYLQQCVDSVLSQSFPSFEVILVDDGSPDRCPEICDEYASKSPLVRVIHKSNGGLSDARNHGLQAARGQYVLFLDSDDYWNNSDALLHLYEELNKYSGACDFLILGMSQFFPDGTVIRRDSMFPADFNSMDSADALQYMMEHGTFPGSACTMAIRRQFLLDHDLFFIKGLKSEDIEWLMRAARENPVYRHADLNFYMYRKGRSDSITASVSYSYLDQVLNSIIKKYTLCPYRDHRTAACLKSYMAYQFTILMAKAPLLKSPEERSRFLAELRAMKNILENDLHPKVRQVRRLSGLLGFDLSCRILGLYLKYRGR